MPDLSAAQEFEASPRRQPPVDLTSGERVAVEVVASLASSHGQRVGAYHRLAVLLAPLETAIKRFQMPKPIRYTVRRAIVCTMQATNTAYGAWDTVTWIGAARLAGTYASRVLMLAYELGCVTVADVLGFGVEPRFLARKVFGRDSVDRELQRVLSYLATVGYRDQMENHYLLARVLSTLLLLAGKPSLEAISFVLIEEAHRQAQGAARLRTGYFRLARVLHGMGIIPNELHYRIGRTDSVQDIDPVWVQWVSRWKTTSTLTESTKRNFYYNLTKVGRWLAAYHPEVQSSDQWTRELAVEFTAAVSRFLCGEFTAPYAHQDHRRGIPLSASAKRNLLETLRAFFRDCQEWGVGRTAIRPISDLRYPASDCGTDLSPSARDSRRCLGQIALGWLAPRSGRLGTHRALWWQVPDYCDLPSGYG